MKNLQSVQAWQPWKWSQSFYWFSKLGDILVLDLLQHIPDNKKEKDIKGQDLFLSTWHTYRVNKYFTQKIWVSTPHPHIGHRIRKNIILIKGRSRMQENIRNTVNFT